MNFIGGGVTANFSAVAVSTPVSSRLLVGNLLYVGFDELTGPYVTTVTDASGSYSRLGAACLNMTTGLWTSFSLDQTVFQGGVSGFAVDGSNVYIGTPGQFTNPLGLNGGSTVNLGRFSLTGVMDQNFDLDLGSNSGFPIIPYFVGSLLYIGAGTETFSSAVHTSGVTRGVLSSVNVTTKAFTTFRPKYLNDANLFLRGSISKIVDLGSGDLLCLGSVQCYQDAGLTTYVATPVVKVNVNNFSGVGSVYLQTNGFVLGSQVVTISSYAFDFAVSGSKVYLPLGQPTGSKVIDLPGTISNNNAGTRTGLYASSFAGAWDTTWNPPTDSIGANGMRGLALYAGDIFVSGDYPSVSGNTARKFLQRFTTANALVTAFNPTFGASFIVTRGLEVYNSTLVVFLNNNGVNNVINGSNRGLITFLNADTGANLS